jgi:uncharacterized protein (DUF305 family)
VKCSTTLTALALASALALVGCGADSSEQDAGTAAETSAPAASAPEGTGTAPASGAAAEISAEHNDDDVMFAQMMIPHHEQAVDMSEILLAKDDVPADVRAFAQKVVDAQGPEIERMNQMLRTWEAPMPGEDSTSMDHGTGGMMSEEDMGMLNDAQGTDAARLYLEQMTVHHEGAVEMARDQVEQGQNPQAVELAQQVVEDQEAEIAEMEQMLQELPDGS